ncbi:UTP--glucose-1-phosphate uridylyltransferase [Candidatus Woesearchaeota archaeon]|nr:UTP--glucose-1-phosphate uridylyltransferase [Candidatus Woesearchaeota archaeon]
MQKVTKAIISAAGYGTRFLPATKNVPKEMLPLIDTPIIHYVVKECIDSGIKDIIIVTREGNNAIEDYFDRHYEIEEFLKKNNKEERMKKFYEVFEKANISYIRQSKSLPYGNASPLLAAKPFLNKDEAFAYLYADDVSDISPATKELIEKFNEKKDASCILGVQLKTRETISKHGAVKIKDNTQDELDFMVEKPHPDKTPSLLASCGRYVFTYEVFNHLNINKLGKDNELWTTDGIQELAKTSKVYIHEIKGKVLTTGDPLNMIKTTLHFALKDPELSKTVKEFLKTIGE